MSISNNGINIGLIGVGYWGPNLIRNFETNPDTNMVICCDLKSDRLQYIKQLYPSLDTTKNYNEIINHPSIDLVAICTPVKTHYKIAIEALNAGKHILIEKPMTSSVKEAEDLINKSEQKGLKIFTDHTFLFSHAVKTIKNTMDVGEIGDIYYFDSVRINLGYIQHDVNVIWDLASHDIYIMNYLFKNNPESVIATGADHLGCGLEDVAHLTVYLQNNLMAHININWLSPVKVRQILIGGSKKMIIWDDLHPIEKIRVYDRGIDVINSEEQNYNTRIQYRTGDMYCPKLDLKEALANEVVSIVNCLTKNEVSVADGHSGLKVVKILEAAQLSIKNKGKEIKILSN